VPLVGAMVHTCPDCKRKVHSACSVEDEDKDVRAHEAAVCPHCWVKQGNALPPKPKASEDDLPPETVDLTTERGSPQPSISTLGTSSSKTTTKSKQSSLEAFYQKQPSVAAAPATSSSAKSAASNAKSKSSQSDNSTDSSDNENSSIARFHAKNLPSELASRSISKRELFDTAPTAGIYLAIKEMKRRGNVCLLPNEIETDIVQMKTEAENLRKDKKFIEAQTRANQGRTLDRSREGALQLGWCRGRRRVQFGSRNKKQEKR